MANTFITPQLVANEALAILRSTCVYKDLVHTDYSKEFVDAIGDTVNVRKPASLVAYDYNGTTVTKQALTETSIPVKLDRFKDVTVKLTSKDKTLELKDFSKQIIAPAMAAIGETIDADAANFIFEKAGNTVSRSKTSPTDIKDISNVGKYFDIYKAPKTDRNFVLSVDHNYVYSLTDNLLKASYAGSNEALRNADLGRLYRMETFMDQNNPTSTATTSGTAVGTMSVAGTKDAEVVAITLLSAASATLAVGDGFVLDGVLYRFTAAGTGTTSAIASLAVSPALASTFTATSVQIVRNSASLAFHKDAIAFVNRPLAIPEGAVKAAVASADGISVRVIYDYDMDLKADIISFDILYGLKELRTSLITRLVDGTLS